MERDQDRVHFLRFVLKESKKGALFFEKGEERSFYRLKRGSASMRENLARPFIVARSVERTPKELN